MNLIFVTQKHGRSRTVGLGWGRLGLLGVFALTLLAGTGYVGYQFGSERPGSSEIGSPEVMVSEWQERVNSQQSNLNRLRTETQHQLDALTRRMGQMQARLLRLDALGERLVESGGLANGEFNFNQAPAVGGPETAGGEQSYDHQELARMVANLDATISSREKQLRLLDKLLSRERLEEERFVAGRPITWGWLSSRYGYRTDPFSGKRAWHDGVDLAGKDGSDIISVAAGVVTYAGDRHGYGNLVEVDHGGGLVTRYAHCKSIEVSVGDVVEKGQVVALMGSTGRSTGPHVHFEVRRNGKSLNPEKYIQRASR